MLKGTTMHSVASRNRLLTLHSKWQSLGAKTPQRVIMPLGNHSNREEGPSDFWAQGGLSDTLTVGEKSSSGNFELSFKTM